MKRLLFISTLSIISITLNAQTALTLRPVNGNGKDAYIETAFSDTNAFNADVFASFTWTCKGALCVGRSLLQFDLSGIPANAIIDSAFLYLYAKTSNSWLGISGQPTYGSDNAGWLQRITQSWSENVVTWNNQPATTTLNQLVIPKSTSATQNYVLNVKMLVRDMVQNPTTSFGFLLRQQNETTWYNSLIFASSDATDTSLCPGLKVYYTIVNGISVMENDNFVTVFPNPTPGQFTISASKFIQTGTIIIDNTLGEKVYSQPFNGNQASVNIKLNAGIYIVRVKDNDRQYVQKIIIE